jgi:hypothetical protein
MLDGQMGNIEAKKSILREGTRGAVRVSAIYLLLSLVIGVSFYTSLLVATLCSVISALWFSYIVVSWRQDAQMWMMKSFVGLVVLHGIFIASVMVLENIAPSSIPWYDSGVMLIGMMVCWTSTLVVLPNLLDRLSKEDPVSG